MGWQESWGLFILYIGWVFMLLGPDKWACLAKGLPDWRDSKKSSVRSLIVQFRLLVFIRIQPLNWKLLLTEDRFEAIVVRIQTLKTESAPFKLEPSLLKWGEKFSRPVCFMQLNLKDCISTKTEKKKPFNGNWIQRKMENDYLAIILIFQYLGK